MNINGLERDGGRIDSLVIFCHHSTRKQMQISPLRLVFLFRFLTRYVEIIIILCIGFVFVEVCRGSLAL